MNQHGEIQFFTEDIEFALDNSLKIQEWLQQVVETDQKIVGAIQYILCSDRHLLEINRQHLDKDEYTDVIAFNYNEECSISGDIYISLERILDNASERNLPVEQELHRVIIHGLLHLLGYKDKTETEKVEIRMKENACLELLVS